MIGQMNDMIRILKASRLSNGRGGWTTKTEDLGNFWAVVLPLSSKELTEFRQVNEQIRSKVFIRYDERLDTDCMIKHDGKTLEVIEMINPKNQKDFIQLLVSGGVRHGE